MKIPYFTFWGCSIDNVVKRPKTEVNFLFKLFESNFKKLLKDKDIEKNKVKINVFGRWQEIFPKSLNNTIKEVIEKTEDYYNHQLTFLMAYSGVDEMTSAIQRIAELRIKNSGLKIDEKLIKNNLWTKNLPAIDLIIRTGGESHLSSGFMMWDIADALLHFTETLWPDFFVEKFKEVLADFGKIERRFGK